MKYPSSNNRSSNSTGTPRNENATQKLIRENVDFLIEQLEAGQSDALTAYLTAMSHFHNYSFGNILQIARQKPDATRVAGLYAWNQLGRRVKKGEKGIQILAPMIGVKRKKDAEAEQDITKQNVPVLVGFRAVYVFDILQTEGKELPGVDGVKGEVGEHRDRLIDFITAQGIELEFNERIAPAMGMSYGGKIVLLPGQSKAEEFATLVHELAHEMLHKAERRTQTTKTVRETEAEAIALGAEDDLEHERDEDVDWDEDGGYEDEPDEGEDGNDDEPGGWWPSRSWERFTPAKPIRVEGGLTTRSRRGAIGETWWSQRFLASVESAMVGGRSTRGRSYARQGQVIDLTVGAGLIEARVQGSRRTPYKVMIAMPMADDDEWDRVVGALAGQAGYAARLLAGELPHEVEDVFTDVGVSLLPSRSSRISTDCTCPDWANPCKHVAAVCYLVAEAFDRDPFILLAWRGRDREAILDRLRQLRGGGVVAPDTAPPPVDTAPPLAECLLGFWKAGPELAGVHIRPEASEMPGAVLRHLPRGVLEVRGRDVAELLEPAYSELALAAERRAFGVPGTARIPRAARIDKT